MVAAAFHLCQDEPPLKDPAPLAGKATPQPSRGGSISALEAGCDQGEKQLKAEGTLPHRWFMWSAILQSPE